MKRDAYLNTLKRNLRGLPSEMQQEFLVEVAQHFSDGIAEGRNEADIADGLGDPDKMAAEYRAAMRLDAFRQRNSMGNLFGLLRGIFGIAGFNLVLGGPVAVLTLFCATLHLLAIGVYLAGVLLVSSGLSGADRIVINDAAAPAIAQAEAKENRAQPQRDIELEILRTGLRVIEPITDSQRPALDVAARWINALLGVLYALLAVPLWNLCIRLDRRAILWLASYARINRKIAHSARTADAVPL